MESYQKSYVRDNCLIAFEVWHINQTRHLSKTIGQNVGSFLLDAVDGVTTVYYPPSVLAAFDDGIIAALQKPGVFDDIIKEYETCLDYLEPLWNTKAPLATKQELLTFIDYAVKGWAGMSIGYFMPSIESLTVAQKELGMAMRERGAEYFENISRTILLTLKKLYPEYADIIRFINYEELLSDTVNKEVLKARKQHFIFFEDVIYTDISLNDWCAQKNITVTQDEVPTEKVTQLKGNIAMKGVVTGPVKIILKKSLLDTVQTGDILVTSMTTPDFLPAMQKAVAFITDEGGITCHAAIVARELGKPCIIGTKIATKVLKDGDRVEVNANTGIVTVL